MLGLLRIRFHNFQYLQDIPSDPEQHLPSSLASIMLMQTAAPSAQALSLSSAKHRNDPAGLGSFSFEAFISFVTNHFVLVPNVNTNADASKIAIDEHLVVEAGMIKAAIDAASNVPNKGAVSVRFNDDNVTPKEASLKLLPSKGWIPVFKPLLSKVKNGRSFFKTLVMMYHCFLMFSGVNANSVVDRSSKTLVTPISPKVWHLELLALNTLERSFTVITLSFLFSCKTSL